MHPLFNQQLAKQHQQDLQREAEAARLVAHVDAPESASDHRYHLNFLRLLYDRTRVLYRRPVVRAEAHPVVVSFEEIKPALMSTFSAMHEVGLVTKYDDQFIEKFMQTFEHELVYQSACKCS
jgi:hypothetical protein